VSILLARNNTAKG